MTAGQCDAGCCCDSECTAGEAMDFNQTAYDGCKNKEGQFVHVLRREQRAGQRTKLRNADPQSFGRGYVRRFMTIAQ